ncbi:hypothetical protein VN12_19555 [Pirellula sp. SH-Sr6A]|uniref:hypothetical protein n=1 Tax=Pirellula sp. SH-Sr6A TaxID=1632865 RepID=UPI00078D42F6|nr:hypothetical protein [Pirellula sp. SH-Sr6A]AMV30909.1 hypothetical protein VN12_02255 [Pirellula sp. SH-Sr6A]AMV34331.1 hypothetical protein VN12_19555 [Pirellula sp. SH-Sr6A]
MSIGQTTVVESIAETLYLRLTPMVNNTIYNTKVREVIRPRRLEDRTIKDRQIVMTDASHDRVPELDHEGNPPAQAWRITFNLYLHVQNDESKCEPIDKVIHTFAADVKKAVCAVDSRWHTFGDKAIDATWQSMEAIQADGSFDGVNLPISITYRVSENDPYQVRS